MSGNKTRDGMIISSIVKSLNQIPGVTVRSGTNHPFVANRDGLRPCPIAASTDAKRMVVPWVAQATGYSNRNSIYDSLRNGEWYK
ncbi:hypothetical protein A3D36_01760 [Candidatus Nomurabacteria bacterium RIFCSPHIGHO2_02_FULL_36_29]|nr:MAG: hypothetical protein A3D36_01760 [Candidatus Nomurabacteria bacterium RIFCSPHIGHO2_02_FULL_36_29]